VLRYLLIGIRAGCRWLGKGLLKGWLERLGKASKCQSSGRKFTGSGAALS